MMRFPSNGASNIGMYCWLWFVGPLGNSLIRVHRHLSALSSDRWHSPNTDLSDLSIVSSCDILVYQITNEVM